MDIPNCRIEANSKSDTIEIIPLNRDISWNDYVIIIRLHMNSTWSQIETTSVYTEKSGSAIFTGIEFERGDEFEIGWKDIEKNYIVVTTIVKAK